ncbi:MAG: SPOR domain-containing protein [Rhodobacteraceae bacterium]|nr:SPOR domain-containing protein [Paracoccaceae bacterium]
MRISAYRPKTLRLLIAGGLIFGLAACEQGAVIGAASSPAPAPGATTVEQDVERPDIFSVTENALWDGRPSLGGVWVAYPDHIDPERVVITNVATGDSVIGALFRRERENPGPAIQLSSDAASAIGVLAGSPTEVSIVVLRRETIEIAPPEPELTAEVEPVSIGEIVEEVLSDTPIPAPSGGAVIPPVPRASATPAEIAPVVAPVAATGPAPAKPFIQIGTFSSEQNAKDLVAILANAGVQAEVRANVSGERTLYRVVSGPASTRSERDERLRIIKSLGFTDAFIFG